MMDSPSITHEFRTAHNRPPVPFDLFVYGERIHLFRGSPHRWEELCPFEPEESGEFDVKFQIGPDNVMTGSVDVVLNVLLRAFAKMDVDQAEEMASTIKRLFLEGQWTSPGEEPEMKPVPGTVTVLPVGFGDGEEVEYHVPDINGVIAYLTHPDDRTRLTFLQGNGWLTSLNLASFAVVTAFVDDVEEGDEVERAPDNK